MVVRLAPAPPLTWTAWSGSSSESWRRSSTGPTWQAQAEEDPVPAPPDRWLPGRQRPESRTPCYPV